MTEASSSMLFRPICIDDAHPLRCIQRRAIHRMIYYTAAQRRAWITSLSTAYLAHTLSHCEGLVCELGGRVSGFVQLDLARARVTALYVEPRCTSRGIGGALLHRIACLASRAGLSAVTLQSSIGAASFYQRRGFRILARRILEIPDVPAFHLFEMHRALVPQEHTWKSQEARAATTTTTTTATDDRSPS
jgi:GNAT superfamily N-acetyltransferase